MTAGPSASRFLRIRKTRTASYGQTFDRFDDAFQFPLPEGARELFPSASLPTSTTIVGVDVVRLSVTWAAPQAEVVGKRPAEIIEGLLPVADEIFGRVFDALRSRGRQPWLGMTGTRHEAKRWRLLDLDGKIRHPAPAIAMQRLWVVNPESVVSDEAALKQKLDGLSPLSLSEALLADALHFRWNHFPQAVAAAVLLAAIACEVGVKDVVRRTAGDRLEAVELLMSRSREFSGAARMLFSQVMHAANGRSLKSEDEELEKAVGRLFEIRNGIAHRSEIPSQMDADACVETAEKVLEWLRTF